MALTCPKCRGEMNSYERNGVTVDQCGECRGLFLDRGELERLVDAETKWHAASAPPPPPQPYVQAPQHYGGVPHYGHKKKKKSFLDEIFDL